MGSKLVSGLILVLAWSTTAHAWYGPLCYPSSVTQIILTLPPVGGEVAGDLRIEFDDNDGKITSSHITASKKVPGAHEILLTRSQDAVAGTVGVILTSPRSTTGYKYEFEFKPKASDCEGAMIQVGGEKAKATKSAALSKAPKTETPLPQASGPVYGPANQELPVKSEAQTTIDAVAKTETQATPAPVASPAALSTTDSKVTAPASVAPAPAATQPAPVESPAPAASRSVAL